MSLISENIVDFFTQIGNFKMLITCYKMLTFSTFVNIFRNLTYKKLHFLLKSYPFLQNS